MDQQTTAAALSGVHGLKIDEAAMRAHVMRPPHVVDMVSSRGLEEGTPHIEFKLPPAPSYHLDVNGFGQALHAALKDCVIGYVMRLRQNDNVIYTLQWNWAKMPSEGGEGWNPSVRMHIASCSKLITAIAMTRLLNSKNMPYDTHIVDYLPHYWVKGPHVNQITFRQLMTQTSGFNIASSNSDYEFMKTQVAAGPGDYGHYHYQNMNFGLCRILMATINGNISPNTTFPGPLEDVLWDFLSIQAYVKYVQDHVFAPSGVSGPTLDHPAADALAYTFPANGNGLDTGNLTSVIGGAGWHMSVDELLSVMGTFRHSGAIMSTAQAQTMMDDGFGLDVVGMQTPIGKLYNKNGAWGDGSRVEQSLAYFLPQNMELVVFANCPICSPGQFFRDKVTKIYTDHIKP